MNRFGRVLVDLHVRVESLQGPDAGYTRKLVPEKPKEEDPRQMRLYL